MLYDSTMTYVEISLLPEIITDPLDCVDYNLERSELEGHTD